MHRRDLVCLLAFVIGLIADQASKAWIVANIELHRGKIDIIPGFLSLVHAQNPGAAMGMLADFEYRQYVFGVFTVIAFAVLADLFRRLPKNDAFMAGTLGLIVSGAAGNAIDRIRQQYVTDFIRVYTEHPQLKPWLIQTVGDNEWPSFNIADSALVVGVTLFLIHYLFLDENDPEPEPPPEGEATSEG